MMGAGSTIQYAMDYSYIIFGFLFIFVYSGVASAIFRTLELPVQHGQP